MLVYIFCMSLAWMASAQENPYDLLSSLNPDTNSEVEGVDTRGPASVSGEQIAVREQLPEAKQKKTARSIQWEVLHKKAPVDGEMESELGE